ncbi:site-specific DNA-methyltransferase [Moraxella catarrhalis]|uniref:site-specific DNA-methyltransferase n=1 Tax=Moraxella catarrhalis TaxID=480 RepID=UPI001D4ED7E4|nr:site-specific DNA-methyltransferase [Moraxella catarrhalis]MPY07955.1 site-specific DNA-methyltransferase [Moraxella catarrhalis]
MDFDTTQNIFIESDNLEALKILQKSYAGKIKMIYIDPPYNTGNDFIYHDDFSQSKKDYEIATGDRDMNGQLLKSFKKNSKDNGHYHSNWLNMMLPRLHLAHTLLSDDGVIFISIDDNEQAQLKLLCDEIFGGENFVADLIRKTKSTTNDAKTGLNLQHENCLIYAKNKDLIKLLGGEKDLSGYSNPDNDPNGDWRSSDPSAKSGTEKNNYFAITNPYTGKIDYPPTGRFWLFSQNTIQKHIDNGNICFKKEHKKNERGFIFKRYKKDLKTTQKTLDSLVFCDNEFMNQVATKELLDINLAEHFNYPKSTNFLKRIIEHSSSSNSIILDFFAGSATTAHAVMQLNAEDDGNRQFIMVQLPELTDEKSEAHKAGFKNIAEISKERIRRAGAKIKAENPDKNIDTGFKVFKLADSNFKAWQIDDDDIAKQLEMYIDPLKDNVNEIDIIYELLLKMGLKLTADIKFEKGVYWLICENKSYAIVLNSLSQDEFHAIIAKKPAKTVVLDKAFLNDSEKSNMILQFKDAGLNFESI